MDEWKQAVTDLGRRLGRLRGRDHERGQTLAEYSLILAFLAVGVILGLTALGAVTTGMFWDPINRVFTETVDLLTP